MKYALKTFLVIILVVLCFWALVIPVQANSRCLYDNANLITQSDEGYINSIAGDMMKNQDYDLCIGTITSLYSMTSMEYAKVFAQTYGFSDDCIVFLIYQDSLYIYQFGNVSLLTNNQINALETGFAIEVANSNTYYALSCTLNNTKQYIQKSSELNDVHNSDDVPVSSSTWKKLLPDGVSLFISCLVTILVTCVMVFFHNSANKKIKANTYLSHDNGFEVTDRTVIFVGTKQEIVRDFYRDRSRR
jgi:uncharacterized membrane protein YgcG